MHFDEIFSKYPYWDEEQVNRFWEWSGSLSGSSGSRLPDVFVYNIAQKLMDGFSTDRQSTWPRVFFGIFGDIFTVNADYIAWKLLKMALEVEYMMEYQHPGLPVTDLHWRSSTDRQSTWPRVIFGPLFVCLFVNKITQKLTDRFW